MHITYDFDYKTRHVVDKSVEKQISDKKSFQEARQSALESCEKLRRQLESEQKKIAEINICFAKFLRQSAIATFNDSYADYLDHFIREEKIKKAADPLNYNDAIFEGLEKTKREYLEKIKIIKEAIATNDPSEYVITPEDIKKYENDLYNLKINGVSLKKMKYVAERSQARAFRQYQSKTYGHRNAHKSVSKLFTRIFNALKLKDDNYAKSVYNNNYDVVKYSQNDDNYVDSSDIYYDCDDNSNYSDNYALVKLSQDDYDNYRNRYFNHYTNSNYTDNYTIVKVFND
ncbi:21114_t:CDS:1 [Dentiscutata erythropus]|uniref:21114_t:CDS:1 n=1 Tax=Dentiscutata erythropus TaxID=1348616 RepID=A0A9N9N9Y8_9GLOM|nr:21114_t:CDS:1 [Dentiscutata erythropus]